MVGVWQQDRWSNGGSRGRRGRCHRRTVERHWTIVNDLKTSLCTGGTSLNGGGYQRATDPWVTFGPSGIAYQLSLSFNDVAPPFTAGGFDHALLASRSTDGGLTWTNPIAVIRDTAPTVFNDKQSITADPTVRGLSTRSGIGSSSREARARAWSPFRRARSAAQRGLPGRRTPAWLRSRPGRSSTRASATRRSETRSSSSPTETLVDIFTEFNHEMGRTPGGFIRVIRSIDKGVYLVGPFDVGRLGMRSLRPRQR